MISPEEDVCPICLEDLEDIEKVKPDYVLYTLDCFHTFHRKCITEWCEQKQMSTSSTCPVCRENICPFWKNQRSYCKAVTKKNLPCKNLAKFSNKGYCWMHRKFSLPPRVRSSSLHQGNTSEIVRERNPPVFAPASEAKRNQNPACAIL